MPDNRSQNCSKRKFHSTNRQTLALHSEVVNVIYTNKRERWDSSANCLFIYFYIRLANLKTSRLHECEQSALSFSRTLIFAVPEVR